MSRGKQFAKSASIERRGIALCASIVAEMDHIWREKPVSDIGIDGEIELVDPQTRIASNRSLLVQVKSRTLLDERSDGTFRFTCSQDDLTYWLSGTAPVVLVMTKPMKGEAWFKNLAAWFGQDPARRKSRVVEFGEADRFTPAASQQLIDWGAPTAAGLYLSSPPRPEILMSNLLRVDHIASSVYIGPSSINGWSDANERLRLAGYETVDDIVWRDGNVWSFRPLDQPPLDALADDTPDRVATDELVDSKSDDDRRMLVRLLTNTLREINRERLAWDAKRNYLYFPASEELTSYRVKASDRGSGRTVFGPYNDKATGSRVVYYRHYALKFQFLYLRDGWFVALNPTYHYTIDGHRPSRFGGEYIKGIKRREGHEAVRHLVAFWATYLGYHHNLFSTADARLRFGLPAEVLVDHGIDDKHWKPPDVAATAHEAPTGQVSLELGGV